MVRAVLPPAAAGVVDADSARGGGGERTRPAFMSIERMRASRFECEYDSERSDTGLAWAVALGRRLDGASGGAEWAGGDKALRVCSGLRPLGGLLSAVASFVLSKLKSSSLGRGTRRSLSSLTTSTTAIATCVAAASIRLTGARPCDDAWLRHAFMRFVRASEIDVLSVSTSSRCCADRAPSSFSGCDSYLAMSSVTSVVESTTVFIAISTFDGAAERAVVSSSSIDVWNDLRFVSATAPVGDTYFHSSTWGCAQTCDADCAIRSSAFVPSYRRLYADICMCKSRMIATSDSLSVVIASLRALSRRSSSSSVATSLRRPCTMFCCSSVSRCMSSSCRFHCASASTSLLRAACTRFRSLYCARSASRFARCCSSSASLSSITTRCLSRSERSSASLSLSTSRCLSCSDRSSAAVRSCSDTCCCSVARRSCSCAFCERSSSSARSRSAPWARRARSCSSSSCTCFCSRSTRSRLACTSAGSISAPRCEAAAATPPGVASTAPAAAPPSTLRGSVPGSAGSAGSSATDTRVGANICALDIC